ncbi:MAG: molybdate ABC transporter permease subunit [Candidatus Bathyarchaeota archaeon]|nr:molybdate ABC transporter permease subunit [Candidatus Bathyarchaeota archaeon]
MKFPVGSRVSNKLVLVVSGSLITAFVLFIATPIVAVFLRMEPAQTVVYLQNPAILNALALGLLTSTAATAASFVFAIPTAYLLANRKFPGKAAVDTLMDLPIILPPAVAGVALLLAFAPKGLLGPAFTSLGITLPGSTVAVIMAQTFVASPLVLRAAKNAFENVDPNIVNSAKILTDSRLRVFFTVTLPLSIRQITSGLMMTWARSMGEFGATLMFAGNLPGITQTMPLAIYLFLAQEPFAAIVLSAIMIGLSFSILVGVKVLEQKKYGEKND